MSKALLRNTETFAAVKVWGAGAETIDLDVDMLVPNRLFLKGATQKVNIISMTWAGEADSTIVVTRNSVVIATLAGATPNEFVFDNMGFNDNIENASDIVVTITGAAHIYLTLRKESGYAQSFEPEIYGAYDNPAVVDDPETLNGNPA